MADVHVGTGRVLTSGSSKKKHVVKELVENNFVPEGDESIAKVLGVRSNNLVDIQPAAGKAYLASLPSKFRKRVWLKRGQYVIIEPISEGKRVRAEIIHILFPTHVRHLQAEKLWPEEFTPAFPDSVELASKTPKGTDKCAVEDSHPERVADEQPRDSDDHSESEDDDSDLFVNTNRIVVSEEEEEEEEEEEDDDDDEDDNKAEEA